jgi:hypothetical protein
MERIGDPSYRARTCRHTTTTKAELADLADGLGKSRSHCIVVSTFA